MSGNNSTEAASGEESVEGEPTEEETGTPANNDTEATAQDIKSTTIDSKDGENKETADKESDNLLSEPTEVTVVDSVEELSKESDATYENDAFFTIDASKGSTSADLATDEVSDSVSDILSGDGSTTDKQIDIVDTLEDSGLYRAEESGKSKVAVTSKFAYQRLRLLAPQETEINACGAIKAVYFGDSYLLSYDSIETAAQAYDSLIAEYGSDAVFIDMPMKLSTGEKGWGTAYMGMDQQKTLEANSGQVTVAVIDSGIQKSHPVFGGKTILQGRDFVNNDSDPADDNGHGTAVSGVIAESTPENVRILPIKAMDSKGEGSLVDIVNAVQYAENSGADIINLSLGGYLDEPSDMEYCDKLFSGYNALIVCASGNENKNMDEAGVMEFPGELSSTVCVGSITASKERSSFSNYGQAVDFAAPGSSIMLAKLGGSYGYNSGTSFASPYIAAAAALVKAGHDDFSKDQMSAYLKTISEDMGDIGKDVYYGNGCPIFSADNDHQRGGSISGQGVNTSVTGIQNKTYDGSAQTQSPSVITNGEVLKQGTDFEISYQNNVNAGTASMTIIGKGYFTGEISGITFTIYPKSITPQVSLSETTYNYTGNEIKPGVTVRDGSKVLTNGTDYTVSYSDNVNAGIGYAKVTCNGNYSGERTVSFTIIEKTLIPETQSTKRIYGSTRYQTAMLQADELKAALNIDKYDSIIVATGENFADALTGSYLGYVKKAPILLVNGSSMNEVREYINNNLASGGTLYILGGEAVVSDDIAAGMTMFEKKRLFGATRYETNIEILKEAGVKEDILICDGTSFADSLSASAAKRPILIVNKKLSKKQREFLGSVRVNNFYLIGGEGVIPLDLEKDIKSNFGRVKRMGGKDRYETSVKVAEELFENPSKAVLAYGMNYPDGLCGGTLASYLDEKGVPLLLVHDEKASTIAAYTTSKIKTGIILGGPDLIADKTVRAIFGLRTEDEIYVIV